MVEEWQSYITEETLALNITNHVAAPPEAKSVSAGDCSVHVWIEAAL
jgi:hypothetical protein